MVVPSKVFFTHGVGTHKDRLVSFEMALRDAHIAQYNLVTVSSILPPDADIVTRDEGLKYISPGEIVYCVLARIDTNILNTRISASIGVAVPELDHKHHGYLSEYHAINISNKESGNCAEDMAATMLATIMNIPFDPETAWNERRQVYLASGKIIKSTNITASAICNEDNKWTSAIAAAVFIMPN